MTSTLPVVEWILSPLSRFEQEFLSFIIKDCINRCRSLESREFVSFFSSLKWYRKASHDIWRKGFSQVADKCIINPSYASVWNVFFSNDSPGDMRSSFCSGSDLEILLKYVNGPHHLVFVMICFLYFFFNPISLIVNFMSTWMERDQMLLLGIREVIPI